MDIFNSYFFFGGLTGLGAGLPDTDAAIIF
jgi:hypothetical protein